MTKTVTRSKSINVGVITHSFNLHFTYDEKLRDQVAIDEFIAKIEEAWHQIEIGSILTVEGA